MYLLYVLAILILTANLGYGQSNSYRKVVHNGDSVIAEDPFASNIDTTVIVNEETREKRVYIYVDKIPQPRYDINRYINKNLQYPKDARLKRVDARVNIQFVVEADGSISDVKRVGTRPILPSFVKEAIRVIEKMPPWQPAEKNGEPVNAYYTLSVIFELKRK